MASSSDWSFLGAVTTKAEAGPTSARISEAESAAEARKAKRQSKAEDNTAPLLGAEDGNLRRRRRIREGGAIELRDRSRTNLGEAGAEEELGPKALIVLGASEGNLEEAKAAMRNRGEVAEAGAAIDRQASCLLLWLATLSSAPIISEICVNGKWAT